MSSALSVEWQPSSICTNKILCYEFGVKHCSEYYGTHYPKRDFLDKVLAWLVLDIFFLYVRLIGFMTLDYSY